jgi:hypothetical protein
MPTEELIPIGTRVKILSVPHEAREHKALLVGYTFRVIDCDFGNYYLSEPFGYTFWGYHLEVDNG